MEKMCDNIDYIWDHYSFYAPPSELKLQQIKAVNNKKIDISYDFENAIEMLYSKVSTADKECLLCEFENTGLRLSLKEARDGCYLTDNGELWKELQSFGNNDREIFNIIKSAGSEYPLTFSGRELCTRIESPDKFTDCYRNLSNVILKCRILGGYGNVQNKKAKSRGTQKRNGACGSRKRIQRKSTDKQNRA